MTGSFPRGYVGLLTFAHLSASSHDSAPQQASVVTRLRKNSSMHLPRLTIECPPWVEESIDWDRSHESDQEKMRLAIELARRNVVETSGGPFGAAIFEEESGRVIAAGVNLVIPANNSVLHAEIVAFMMAQARIRSYTLGGAAYTLATSCDPCAMCLGACLWSGVRRIICGAKRQDAEALNFDEGPVFPESYTYLEERGIKFRRSVCRKEAAAVFDLYLNREGPVYNG